jgi:hypothetical protein
MVGAGDLDPGDAPALDHVGRRKPNALTGPHEITAVAQR